MPSESDLTFLKGALQRKFGFDGSSFLAFFRSLAVKF